MWHGHKNLPGSFFVLNDALVIADLAMVCPELDGVTVIVNPIGPSSAWPTGREFFMALVT